MNVTDTLRYRLNRIGQLRATSQALSCKREELTEEKQRVVSQLEIIEEASAYYKKSQDILYAKSIGALESLVNKTLKYVFYDKNYSLVIELQDKRGTKFLNFRLRDEDMGREVSLKNGCGNGVRSVVSSILNIFVILSKQSDFLILDEKYSHISSEYVDSFFNFLNTFCEKEDFKIILITHDDRFVNHAKKVYRIVDGRVTSVE